jgi:hypothetical protein
MTAARAIRQKKKIKIWTTPTVLGLILSVVGAVGVIELRPQMTVTPADELEKSQPFSAPFRITNTGYLSLTIKSITFYVHELEVGGSNIGDNTVNNPAWNNFDLDSGGSKTIRSNFLRSNVLPSKADIVIVIDYTFIGINRRHYSRFEGAYVDNWEWMPQPYADIVIDIDKAVNRATEIRQKSVTEK